MSTFAALGVANDCFAAPLVPPAPATGTGSRSGRTTRPGSEGASSNFRPRLESSFFKPRPEFIARTPGSASGSGPGSGPGLFSARPRLDSGSDSDARPRLDSGSDSDVGPSPRPRGLGGPGGQDAANGPAVRPKSQPRSSFLRRAPGGVIAAVALSQGLNLVPYIAENRGLEKIKEIRRAKLFMAEAKKNATVIQAEELQVCVCVLTAAQSFVITEF